MVQAGDLVFVKKVKTGPSKDAVEVALKGHAMCLLVGHINPGAAPPTKNQIEQLLGSIGLVGLDDIGEFLGKDQLDKFIQAHQEKYHTKGKPSANDK